MTPPKFNGRRTNGHLILRQLGHGNLTRVFLATGRAKPGGALVVLKLLHPELAKDDEFRALYLDQAAPTLALRHPNLVRTLEVVADADACGITLEFLQGQTLARVLERVGRQRFPVDLHLHILSKVLEALDYAQQFAGPAHPDAGFMHRDVCPSNVFITYDGHIKLLGAGFGNAVRVLEGRLGRPLLDVKYAAPEVLLGFPSGPSADVFAVGVLLWEAVARQARVNSDDPRAVMRRRTNGEEPDLEKAWPDAAEPLIALCSRSLAMNPGDRYPTSRAFRADLEAYLRRAPETSDAVLGRMPELMEEWFGSEREQMQLFIRARLDAVDSGAPAASRIHIGDELTDDEEWRAETRTAESAAKAKTEIVDLAAPDATTLLGDPAAPEAAEGFRTGLRRARPELLLQQEAALRDAALRDAALRETALQDSVRRETGVHVKELRHSEAELQPSASQRPSLASRLFGAPGAAPAPSAPELAQPAESLPSAPEPAPPENTPAEHQAYTSNLGSVWPRRASSRLSPDMLGAAALLVGSLVAAYSFYRHTQRSEQTESPELAVQAEVRAAAPPPPHTSLVQPLAAPAPGPPPRDLSHDVAHAGGQPVSGPAFFDGHEASSGSLGAPPSLRADELPAVDPALRSLQDAIVLAAKAHRIAIEHRRSKKGGPASNSSSPVPRRTERASQPGPGQR